MKVAVLGASGNVGRMVVKHLLQEKSVEHVLLVGRRKIEDFSIEIQQDTRIEQILVDMSQLENDCSRILSDVKVGFITMGAGAPSKSSPDDLQRIDCTLPTEFASAAKKCGVPHMVLLTSVAAQYKGENANVGKSTVAGSTLYLHIKGMVEKNISGMDFDSVSIFRPATLVGNSNTPGIFNWLAPKLNCVIPTKYNSIHIDDLGKCMVKEGIRKAQENSTEGTTIYEGDSLFNVLN